MGIYRIRLCALAAAVAASLTGEVNAQAAAPGVAAPAPSGKPGLSQGSGAGPAGMAAPAPADATRQRNDPTAPSARSPASTQPSASKGLANGAPVQGDPGTAPGATGAGISGGVPAMSGVTPNRAELPGSAFTKLDTGSRGYVTLEDVRQLQGFESAFRDADQNGDGRLNASEFNSAWGAFTGNTR